MKGIVLGAKTTSLYFEIILNQITLIISWIFLFVLI